MGWRRGMALSQDLRDRVLAAPGPPREMAGRFGVSVSYYVIKARAKRRETGDATAGVQRNHVPPRLAGHEEALRTEVARRLSATCDDLRAWAAERGGGRAHGGLEHAGPIGPDAQNGQVRATEQDRSDVAEARRAWSAAVPTLDASRLVFLDETWATTNMAPRYGRAPRGQRALHAVPHGHRKITTFVGAMRASGFVAPSP